MWPNSNQHTISPYPESVESNPRLHALFFSHLEERYYSMDVIWVLADAKDTKCVPFRIFQSFVARFKNINIFMFLQNKVKDNVVAMVLNPWLCCLLSTNGISCRSVTSFICCLLSRIIAPQGAFLEVQLEMDGPKRARGTGHLLNFLLTRLPNASALRNFVYNRRAQGSELFSPQKIWLLYSKTLKPCSVVQSVQEIVTGNLKVRNPVVSM